MSAVSTARPAPTTVSSTRSPVPAGDERQVQFALDRKITVNTTERGWVLGHIAPRRQRLRGALCRRLRLSTEAAGRPAAR